MFGVGTGNVDFNAGHAACIENFRQIGIVFLNIAVNVDDDRRIQLLDPRQYLAQEDIDAFYKEAMSGDYVTTLTASSSDASDSAEFRITVKTETKWGLTGIGIIVVLAVVIILVMRKYGRR